MTAGGLLLVLAALSVGGSFLNLAEFRSEGDFGQGILPYQSAWGAWTSGDPTSSAPGTQQLLGIGMIVMAVVAVLGGVLLLAGLGAGRRAVRAVEVTSAAMAFGGAAAMVGDVGSAAMTADDSVTTTLGPGFWVMVVATPVAAVGLGLVLSGSAAGTAYAPRDGYGRPLAPRAGGLEIAVGVLSLLLAGLMIAAMFFSQLDNFGPSISLWWVDDKTQLVGVPFAVGVLVLVVAAVMSFTGRGRMLSTGAASFLLGAGLLIVLDTVSQELFGPVRLDDFGIGFWVLLAATVLALLVTGLAFAATASEPRYRTPYSPVAPHNPQWNAPNPAAPGMPQYGYPQAGFPQTGPVQGGFTPGPPPQGWTPSEPYRHQ
ncbi:hypothetical protein [Nocardia jejuensis]|uniref:hypothetical protein n=1 Tax=Nocardia jejuensis TaxID=328049 RepID=UPI000836592E|nr:hypothetical protein [Nocardia jejuensis]